MYQVYLFTPYMPYLGLFTPYMPYRDKTNAFKNPSTFLTEVAPSPHFLEFVLLITALIWSTKRDLLPFFERRYVTLPE